MKLKSLGAVSAIGAIGLGLWACSADRTSTSSPSAVTATAVSSEGGRASASGVEKVTICHIPPGNPENAHTITVGEPAVAAHVEEHGDTIGACVEPSPSPSPGG
jgi:hypothetical protein